MLPPTPLPYPSHPPPSRRRRDETDTLPPWALVCWPAAAPAQEKNVSQRMQRRELGTAFEGGGGGETTLVGNPGPLSPVRSYVRIMADATAKKKVPTLMAATLLGARLGGSDPKEKVKLKVRMEKLKESIVREATVREAEMRDKEEKSAIIAAIDCLETTKDQEEAIDRCCDILRERLGHLYRREEQFKAVRGRTTSRAATRRSMRRGGGGREGEGARRRRLPRLLEGAA